MYTISQVYNTLRASAISVTMTMLQRAIDIVVTSSYTFLIHTEPYACGTQCTQEHLNVNETVPSRTYAPASSQVFAYDHSFGSPMDLDSAYTGTWVESTSVNQEFPIQYVERSPSPDPLLEHDAYIQKEYGTSVHYISLHDVILNQSPPCDHAYIQSDPDAGDDMHEIPFLYKCMSLWTGSDETMCI